MTEVGPMGFQCRRQIGHGLLQLLLHPRSNDFAFSGDANLTGNEQELAGLDNVSVGLRPWRRETFRIVLFQLLCGCRHHRQQKHRKKSNDGFHDLAFTTVWPPQAGNSVSKKRFLFSIPVK